MPARFLLLSALILLPHLSPAWELTKSQARPAPEGLQFREAEVSGDGTRVRLAIVTFSAQKHTFALMDDPQKSFDLASASRKRGAVAAVNGGYFKPDREPLGLRIRQGRQIHPLERAKLLSGMLVVTADRISLLRVGEFKSRPGIREAVQAGPFLVDGGRPVAGLNATRSAMRTVIIGDGKDRWGLVTSSPVTLAEMSEILAKGETLVGLKISRALNLDGGSSTGMWVDGNPPYYSREFRDVRDFVGIVPR